VSDVPPGVTLLLGGARSGKSSLAVELGRAFAGEVVLIATARVDADDADLAGRVARHRAERPSQWRTVETTDVVPTVRDAPPGSLVIVDCVTLWVADAFDGPLDHVTETAVGAMGLDLAVAAAARPGPTVLVSNEVGLGVHPSTELGRRYRDALGRVNTALATHADRTLLLVAGRALALHDPWTLLR
jgi:adenosylcobinamide kinase/adenosylcobinamide-phosphate guanylyltransferase